MELQLKNIQKEAEGKSIEETLSYLSEKHPDRVAFSTSFGEEDQVITDFILKNNFPIKVFTLDTGRLFKETYDVFYKTTLKYKKNIKTYFPDTEKVQKLMTIKGPNSFYDSIESRKECCEIRKIEPLRRALNDIDIWITGLRAEQSENRHDMSKFQYDAKFDCIKYSPIIDWKYDEMKSYIAKNGIPYNVLHDKGFLSIGCAPCTRSVSKGEDIRSGRWWWEASKKECGLHG
ncbi:MAG: phosphoadenylyl-sulfate reductase [Flavobacteriales bacterium]